MTRMIGIFFRAAFDRVGGRFTCDFVNNGYDLLAYLKSAVPGSYPCLIVLDINMPGLDGIATLRQLKSDERYRAIPAALVSTARPDAVAQELKRLNVLYRTKPDTIADLVDLVIELLLLAGSDF